MWLGQDDTVQGLGCPGGTCLGADGNLYEWVQGVDGLGNPIGFWKRLKRIARRAVPLARRFAPLIPGGAAAAALTAAAPLLRRAAPYVQRVAAAVPGAVPAMPVPPQVVPVEAEPTAEEGGAAGWGLGAADLTELMGIGYVDEVAEGPDGNLYQWVQGVDGLGNPVGFWKRLRRGIRSLTRRALPLVQRAAAFVPGPYGAAIAAGLRTATPFLRQAGVAGSDGIGALYEASDGSLYQVQGIDDDEELRGLGEDEIQGLADDEELRGLEDDQVDGAAADDEDLRGLAEEDDLRGYGVEEMQGFAQDEVQGVDGYMRQDGVSGLEGFVPDAARETLWFKTPAQAPPLWAPLW